MADYLDKGGLYTLIQNIKDKTPTKTSDLENDVPFSTEDDTNKAIDMAQEAKESISILENGAVANNTKSIESLETSVGNLSSEMSKTIIGVSVNGVEQPVVERIAQISYSDGASSGGSDDLTERVETLENSRGRIVYGQIQGGINVDDDEKAINNDPVVEELHRGLALFLYSGDSYSTADNPAIKVEGCEARPIWVNDNIVSPNNPLRWGRESLILYVYDGTYWNCVGTQETYFVKCETESSTENKIIDSLAFVLKTGVLVTVRFSDSNISDSPTLNIGETGAYNISGNTKWDAGDVVTFMFDGTQYVSILSG